MLPRLRDLRAFDFCTEAGVSPKMRWETHPTFCTIIFSHICHFQAQNSAAPLRYGDIFSIDVGPFRQIMVCDLDVLRDMMSMDVFSGRGKPTVMGINIFANMKGGHGGYGLVTSEGQSVCGGQIQNPTRLVGLVTK